MRNFLWVLFGVIIGGYFYYVIDESLSLSNRMLRDVFLAGCQSATQHYNGDIVEYCKRKWEEGLGSR